MSDILGEEFRPRRNMGQTLVLFILLVIILRTCFF